MPQMVETMNKPSCVMCEFLMQRIKSWLEDGHTADELEGDLEKMCNLLPGTVSVNIFMYKVKKMLQFHVIYFYFEFKHKSLYLH